MNIMYDELESGKRYKLTMSDCCIAGEIIGRFEKYIDEEEDDWYSGDLKFDIGIFTVYNRIDFEELND